MLIKTFDITDIEGILTGARRELYHPEDNALDMILGGEVVEDESWKEDFTRFLETASTYFSGASLYRRGPDVAMLLTADKRDDTISSINNRFFPYDMSLDGMDSRIWASVRDLVFCIFGDFDDFSILSSDREVAFYVMDFRRLDGVIGFYSRGGLPSEDVPRSLKAEKEPI